ncbi:MAG: hypothetical protein QHJ82_15170, partial [Verrucomicrobiota bacterium]|nr:hypothetical protein [Verrucomicrobiota bacterium]
HARSGSLSQRAGIRASADAFGAPGTARPTWLQGFVHKQSAWHFIWVHTANKVPGTLFPFSKGRTVVTALKAGREADTEKLTKLAA